MSARIRSTFPVFEITIAGALLLIGWAAFRLYEIVPEVDESRHAMVQLRDEYFGLGDSVQTNMSELDDALESYLDEKQDEDLERFQKQSAQWSQWMGERRRAWLDSELADNLATNNGAANRIENEMLPLLAKIELAYTNYLKPARFILSNTGRPFLKDQIDLREKATQRAKQRLLMLGRQARMRGEAMDLALNSSQERFGNLTKRFRDLRFGLLLAAVALSFLLILVVYRGKIAQTQAIIQEHKNQQVEQQTTLGKLKHFGQLAQELAHEIKQPLTAMNARAYTLQRTLSAGTEAHKDAAVIRNEIKRLDQIVKDFLDLARPNEPNLAPIQAREALEDVRELMAPQMIEQHIDFRFECDDDLQLMADIQQLKQVLINLVKNAAESLGGDGTVTLRGRKGTRQLRGKVSQVAIIEVEDTGPGIPLEIRGKIFDPFFSTKGDGTGLGLAIASRIIDKHGGNLEFDTQLGKGTIFRIVLPPGQSQNELVA
jgi:signal transduction histidine kinase